MSQTSRRLRQRKILVMGGSGVGKSAIVVRLVENRFLDTYIPTVHETFHKVIEYQGSHYSLEIVASSDQHNLCSIGVDGYILVYSIDSRSSFEQIQPLNNEIEKAFGTLNVPRVLLANKIDFDTSNSTTNLRKVSTKEGIQLANQIGCGRAFLECSAKTPHNIQEAFSLIIYQIESISHKAPIDNNKPCFVL